MDAHGPLVRWQPAMRAALQQAVAALAHDDVPVGAVVVYRGEVIAARHNERELRGDPTAHAELLALRDAAAHIGNWRLDECTLVVTLEPCPMCAGAIVNRRVDRTTGVLAEQCARLLVDFFGARRRP